MRSGNGLLAQAMRFGAVGIFATALNGGIYWLATRNGWLTPLAANAAGFAVAFSASFLGHLRWTFAAHAADSRSSLPRFLVTAILGFGCNSLAAWWFTAWLGLPPASALPVIMLATPTLLFVLSRYWVFAVPNKKREPADKPGSV